MAANNNDIRVKRTKKLIRQGLVELSATKRINKITVKELTDYIEINRGTFYLHYKDVYDLIESLENELYADFDKKLASFTPEALLTSPVDVCEDLCFHFYEHRDLYTTFIGVNGDAHFAFKIGERFNASIHDLFKGLFPKMSGEDYDLAYTYAKFGLVGITHIWFTKYPEKSPREIAEMWLNMTHLGLWGILDDEGKEVLLNAENSR